MTFKKSVIFLIMSVILFIFVSACSDSNESQKYDEKKTSDNAMTAIPSDEEITTEIQKRIARDRYLSSNKINVVTQDNIVTLSGEVENIDKETSAKNIAFSVSGVKDVISNLKITGSVVPQINKPSIVNPGTPTPEDTKPADPNLED